MNRNDIGLGLVLGGGITVVVLVYGGFILDFLNCFSFQNCESFASGEFKSNDVVWWMWAKRFFSYEDSLAVWLAAIFTGLNVMFLWRTLKETRRTTMATREIGEAEVRAYLYVDTINVTFDKEVIKGEVLIANSGNSPAFEIEACNVWASSHEDGFLEEWNDTFETVRHGNLHPHQNTWRPFQTDKNPDGGPILEPVHIDMIMRGHAKFWLHGTMEYSDVFGKRWLMKYRYEAIPDRKKNPFRTALEGNSLEQVN